MATAATWEADDEWELINDDGFVYKRKRHRRIDDFPSSSSTAPPQLSDQTIEINFRLEQKKITLVKLKERYQREICQWENLSNTLSNILQTSSAIQQQEAQETTSSDHLEVSSVLPEHSSDSTCRKPVDELISQAEAEEGIIETVDYLCDIAEAICCAKEESSKQSFIQLPVWALSPRELIKSLSVVDD